MKLEKWALIAEIVGGVAIVVSLVFVGLEVRQSARTNIQTLTQAVVSDYQAAVVALGDTHQMACILSRALQNYDSITGSERVMLNNRLFAVFGSFQEMHVLREQGAFDSSLWSGYEAVIESATSSPGVRQWWSIRSEFFGERFRAYVDEMIDNPAATEPVLYNDPSCTRQASE